MISSAKQIVFGLTVASLRRIAADTACWRTIKGIPQDLTVKQVTDVQDELLKLAAHLEKMLPVEKEPIDGTAKEVKE